MSTRLVERLERDIAHCEDPFEHECLKAEHAAVIARLGQLDHARFVLAGLKTQARRHGKPRLQAWVHFVAGAINCFSSVQSLEALENFKAAAVLAREGGDRQLQALACAWSAAVEIQCSQFAEMFGSLSATMRHADHENHPVWARTWLVIADAADCSGLTNEAMRCYEVARRHAVADGDSSMVSLIMCNRANSLVSHHARHQLFGTPVHSTLGRVLSEIESTRNLDQGLGNTALDSSVPIIQSEALMLNARWSESIDLANRNLDRQVSHGGISFSARQLANRAWCHTNVSDMERAWADAQLAIDGLVHVTNPEDQAVVHGRLSRVFELLGRLELASAHRAESEKAHKAQIEFEKQVCGMFDEFKTSTQKAGHPWPQD